MAERGPAGGTTVRTAVNPSSRGPAGPRACLVVIHGAELGRKFELDRATMEIGRAPGCAICIDEEAVSRTHAQICGSGDGFSVLDLKSTNGTLVNDELVEERALRNGDLIRVGETVLKFLSADSAENRYHDDMYRLTTLDALTELFNKRYFNEALAREWHRAVRLEQPLSLLVFDVDFFKKINDSYTHLGGDAVLKQIASRARSAVRREEVLARYGGEEFVLLMPGADPAEARRAGERLCRLVRIQPFKLDDREITVTISVGIAQRTPELRRPEELLRRADERLYEAKRAGRDRVVG